MPSIHHSSDRVPSQSKISPSRLMPPPRRLTARAALWITPCVAFWITPCVALCGMLLLASPRAHAQALPAARLPSQVAAVQFIATQPYGSGQWVYGYSGSLELKSTRWWGIEAQGSGEHWIGPTTRYFGGAGPQFVLSDKRFRFHGVALAGASRDRLLTGHGTLTDPQYSAAVRAGGGVDFRVSRHWLLRIGEVYWTRSFLQPNVQSIDYSQGLGYVF